MSARTASADGPGPGSGAGTVASRPSLSKTTTRDRKNVAGVADTDSTTTSKRSKAGVTE